jgi:hypothetical protein
VESNLWIPIPEDRLNDFSAPTDPLEVKDSALDVTFEGLLEYDVLDLLPHQLVVAHLRSKQNLAHCVEAPAQRARGDAETLGGRGDSSTGAAQSLNYVLLRDPDLDHGST